MSHFSFRTSTLALSLALAACGPVGSEDVINEEGFEVDLGEATVPGQSCVNATVCTTSVARPQCAAASTEGQFAFETHQAFNVPTTATYSFARFVLRRGFEKSIGVFRAELREFPSGSTSIDDSVFVTEADLPGGVLPRANTPVTLHFASPVTLAPATGATPRYVLVLKVTDGAGLSVGVACAETPDALPGTGITAGLRKSKKVGSNYVPGPWRTLARDLALALGNDGQSRGPCATVPDATCDDGNGVSGDGCSAACQVEPNYVCTGVPSVCIDPTLRWKVSVAVTGLSGSLVLSLDGTEAKTVTTDGTSAFTRMYADNAAYAVTITTQPAGQACTLGANATGTLTADRTVNVTCANSYTVTNNQAAVIAIGQTNLTSSGNGATASSFFAPAGNPVYHQGKLYVVDRQNNRILRFNGVPTSMPGTAELALGQPNLTSNTAGSGVNQLRNPQAIAATDTQLFVADGDNRRIVVYDLASMATGMNASFTIGSGSGCSALSFSFPAGVAIAGNKLIVSDFNQHRVLVWNTIPTNGTTQPDFVLGQTNFTTCSSGTSSTKFLEPYAVFADANRLVLSEFSNRRVLVWSPFPTATNTAASLVIGKPDFATKTGTASQSVLAQPYAAAMSGEQLFVADTGGHRIMVWNTFPTTNGAPADRVIGQADFTTTTPGVSATKLSSPQGVAFVLGKFLVTDSSNSRVLVYQNPP